MALIQKSGRLCCNPKLCGSVFELVTVRCLSTAATELKPERISKNLSFRPGTSNKFKSEERPLVLIYGWLGAKAQHIHKYGDFYVGKGFDVLHIKVEPLQLLWPRRAQAVISQIVDFVSDAPRRAQPILVHGFSVGGYLYGETLVKFTADPTRLDTMKKRVRGQIFDSPVDFQGVPRGVGMAVSNTPIVQKSIKLTLDVYLKLFYSQVTKYYIRSSGMFHENPLRCPSLMLYSLADKVGDAATIQQVLATWKRNGVPVQIKCWEDTPHVEHFRHHPVQYIGTVNSFLSSIGLQSDSATTVAQNSTNPIEDSGKSTGALRRQN